MRLFLLHADFFDLTADIAIHFYFDDINDNLYPWQVELDPIYRHLFVVEYQHEKCSFTASVLFKMRKTMHSIDMFFKSFN